MADSVQDRPIFVEDKHASIGTNLNPDRILEELKHSIRTHLVIMQGPTPQLAVFCVKLIDFLEDMVPIRRCDEMSKLAFSIVEAVALHIQQSIDTHAQRASGKNVQFPKNIQDKSDHLLVVLGKSRGLPDKISAKSALLKEIAETLRALSTYTKAKYPDITDIAGNIL